MSFLLGKITNLQVACSHVHGCLIGAGEVFSFWRQIGRPSASRGFVLGREVREGCILPTVGGGLCQLSGSLLEAAVAAGAEVVERHGHTALPDDIAYRSERDATVFWNYVDLRLRIGNPVLIEALVTETDLEVRIYGKAPRHTATVLPVWPTPTKVAPILTESCYSCDEVACTRHRTIRGPANGVEER